MNCTNTIGGESMNKRIKVLYFAVNKKAELIEIENNLPELQRLVSGYIQVVLISKNLCIICNELGKIENLPYQEKYRINGDFVVAQTYRDELVSIDEDSADKIIKEMPNLTSILL